MLGLNIKIFLETSFYEFQFSHLGHSIPGIHVLPFSDPSSPFYPLPLSLCWFTHAFLLLLGSYLAYLNVFSLPKKLLPIFTSLVPVLFLYETRIDQLNPQ